MNKTLRLLLLAIAIGLVTSQLALASSVLVYKGKFKQIGYEYDEASREAFRWGPDNDSAIVVIELDTATNTVLDSYAFEYWSEGAGLAGYAYGLYNLETAVDVASSRGSASLFSYNFHDDLLVPGTLMMEGKLSSMDLGPMVVDLPKVLKGYKVDNYPGLVGVRAAQMGAVLLKIDKKWTLRGNDAADLGTFVLTVLAINDELVANNAVLEYIDSLPGTPPPGGGGDPGGGPGI